MIQQAPSKYDAPYEQSPGEAHRTWAVVVLLLVVHSGLLAYSAYVHSPTLNEPGHLAAGISHWEFGRFDLYRVNPPLVRMVAALPVMSAGVEADWSEFHEMPGGRPVFAVGEDLIRVNGERSSYLFMIARWACIPFSLIGAVVCYLWARDLYGEPGGLLAMTLWCFSPNILAHASLITADAPATALALAGCYTFWRWLRGPAWKFTFLSGVVLGVAGLTKATLVIFYPLWPLMWALYRLPDRAKMQARDWFREGAMVLAGIAACIYVVNLGYGFEGSGTRLGKFHFVSSTLSGKESAAVGNRFVDSWLENTPVPFPKNYILGIDVQRRDFEEYGQPSYLRGCWRDHGWWYYYLYALLIKVPLGTWMLFLLAIAVGLSCWKTPEVPHRLGGMACNRTPVSPAGLPRWKDEIILLFPAAVLFVLVSSQTGFSEHMRYILPCFPCVFIWIGRIAHKMASSYGISRVASRRIAWNGLLVDDKQNVSRPLPVQLAAIALVGSVGSSLWAYPHSLSYFNESIGGAKNAHQHLLGSNLDWGQDLFFLRKWNARHQHIHPLFVLRAGLYDPSDLV